MTVVLWYFVIQQLITNDQCLRYSTTQPWFIYPVVFLKISQMKTLVQSFQASFISPPNAWFSFLHLYVFPGCVLSLWNYLFTFSTYLNLTHSSRHNIYIVYTTFNLYFLLSFKVHAVSNSLYGKLFIYPSKWPSQPISKCEKNLERGVFCYFLSPTSLLIPVQLCCLKNKVTT